MKEIITKDGSSTFFSEEYQETYHSTTGAKEEALKKFVDPTKEKKNPKILDICFGLGYNSAAALEVFKECSIIGLEKDKEILTKIQKINPQFTTYQKIKDAVKGKEKSIKIILGDARKTITSLPDQEFDIIFLDPFSPKKCPELWTEEFLQNIYKKTAPGGILTTYSCAKEVRQNLVKAGFQITDGPAIGRRGPATIATKTFIN